MLQKIVIIMNTTVYKNNKTLIRTRTKVQIHTIFTHKDI